MKKKYLFIGILSTMIVSLQAQFQWAQKGGRYAYDYGYGVVTDNAGNVYVAGKYEDGPNDPAIFNTTTVTCAGNHDSFLAQYSPNGDLNWIRTAGGADGDYAEAVACDGTNYVYISGESEGGGVISFVGSTVTLQNVGDNDAFFAKYDLSGNLIMARKFGGYESEKALGITYDNAGNIYICGYYTTTTTINGNNITGWGGRDIYLAKYDANGNFQWFKNAGSAGRDEAKFIKCDNSGNVYICGMCSNNSVFGSQTITTPDAFYDSFLAKYSTSDGSLQWVKVGGADLDDVAWSLTLDNSGSVYISGEFNSYIAFGSTSGIPTTGAGNVYVAKFDGSGNVSWIKGAGGPMQDRARGIGSDGTNVYITGQFGGTALFDTYSVTAPDSSDIFIAGLTPAGSFMWATSVGGPADALETLGYESGNAICAVSGAVYATGGLLDGGIFGSTTVSPWSRTDMFITKLATAQVVGLTDTELVNSISVYPNPSNGHVSLNLSQLSGQTAEVAVYDYLGALVDAKSVQSSPEVQIDLSGRTAGVYIVEVKTEDQKTYRKKLIVNH